MTIDGRVKSLMLVADKSAGFESYLKTVLLEVARDQRQAAITAVTTLIGDSNNPWMIDKCDVIDVITDATIR